MMRSRFVRDSRVGFKGFRVIEFQGYRKAAGYGRPFFLCGTYVLRNAFNREDRKGFAKGAKKDS
jgi:hypothetical protein